VILTAGSLSGEFVTVNYPDAQEWWVRYDTTAGTVTVGISGNVHNVTQGTWHATIQDALDMAANGDVIELGACTFDEWGFALNNMNLTIRGQGRDQTVIDGGWNGRVFSLGSDDSIFEDLTIRRGVPEAANGGGAVKLGANCNPVFRRVDFRDCDGTGYSTGAVDCSSGLGNTTMVFEACRFLDNFGANIASAFGSTTATTTFINCLFAGNSDANKTLYQGNVDLVNCTFADNTDNWGVNDDNSTTVTNCVFDGSNPSGSVGGSPTVISSLYPGAPAGSIDGLPTFEDAGAGDYRLAAGSLGIDAADYDVYIDFGGGAEDLNGDPCPVDDTGTADTGNGMFTYLDMGAYEFQGTSSNCPADIDGDGVVAFADLVALLASWGPCADCPADIDGDGAVGFSDLVSLLATWGNCP